MAVKVDALTIRMNPRVKWVGQIAARHQHMTLSNFIEMAIEEKIERITSYSASNPTSLDEILAGVYFPDECARFCFFADKMPSLLTDEERTLWMLIQSDDALWHAGPDGEAITRDGNAKNGIRFDVLEEKWPALKEQAQAMLS